MLAQSRFSTLAPRHDELSNSSFVSLRGDDDERIEKDPPTLDRNDATGEHGLDQRVRPGLPPPSEGSRRGAGTVVGAGPAERYTLRCTPSATGEAHMRGATIASGLILVFGSALAGTIPAKASEARDWTVVTMAADGSWGVATASSVGPAIADAIRDCRAMA